MKNKGGLDHQPAQFSDIMSTCVELAGATYPKEYQGRAIQMCIRDSYSPPCGLDAVYSEELLSGTVQATGCYLCRAIKNVCSWRRFAFACEAVRRG